MRVKHRNKNILDRWLTKIKGHPKMKEALSHIIHPDHSPRATAFSIAAGVFIGIFIPVGLQLITVVLISPLKKINVVLTTLATLLSNPFTVLPLYWLGITVGEWALQINFPWHTYDTFMEHPSFQQFLAFGEQGILILMTGLLVMAIPGALISYLISWRVAVILRRRHQTEEEAPIQGN